MGTPAHSFRQTARSVRILTAFLPGRMVRAMIFGAHALPVQVKEEHNTDDQCIENA